MRNDPAPSPSARLFERLPLAGVNPLARMGAALLLIAAAFTVRVAVGPWMPPGFPFSTFFAATILAAVLFGARAGILAAVAGGLLAWYVFIPPVLAFKLDRGVVIALAFYAFVTGTQILLVHWMQRANGNLAAERAVSARLADTRELLFRELQHRISNNLQVAAALLTLQRRKVKHADARAALDEASRRLALIGRISRQLYDAGGGTRSLRDFLEPLCADVIDASGKRGITLAVHADAELALGTDQSVPLALIVAEAISNSIEHGFADREAGRIDVTLAHADEGTIVEIHDDGRGLPSGFRAEASDSLGLRIATTLATQLGGRFTLEPAVPGSLARLTLPASA